MDDHHTSGTPSELDQLTLRSPADLQRMWELLMQPLGFRTTSLWVTFIGPDDRPTRFLIEIAESEAPARRRREVANLFDVLHQVHRRGSRRPQRRLPDHPPRPRRHDSLRPRASGRLLDGARAAGVPTHPVHVADDVAVRAVTPDDLAA